MARREAVLESWSLARAAEREMRDAQEDARSLHDRLRMALGQAEMAVAPRSDLPSLLAAAQSAVDHEAQAEALRQAVADSERETRKREQAVQCAAQADAAWQGAWSAACAACWLGADAASRPLAIVRELLAAAATLQPALLAAESLAGRIADMQADQAAFGGELDRLAAALGIAPGPLVGLDLAQSLHDRVQQADRAEAERWRLQGALAAAREVQRAAAAAALAHARRVDEMTAFMQAGSLIELAGKLRDAEQKAAWIREAAQAETDIVAAARVTSLAEAETILESRTATTLEADCATLSARLEDLDPRTRELFATSRQATDQIDAVGGDDAAARIEARRRTILLEIEDKAGRHLRLRVGIAAADRALRVYRDRHCSAMMVQASDAFRLISRGAYRGLGTQPDRDGDILVALAADGASKLAADLSKGTRFQLYLALRAAGYRDFARLRPPVPFIADDIMETFDDARAEETLRLLAEIAQLGR